MPETAAQERCSAHLPHEPGQGFRAPLRLGGQELPKLLGQVNEDRAGLEDADRFGPGPVDERWDLRVWIDRHKARAELIALADVDQPGVVLGACVTALEQLLEHDRDLDPVWGTHRIELKRMLAGGQRLVVGRAGDRPVDVGETTAVLPIPGPHLGRDVLGGLHHA